jgi:hypothetical protein
MRIKGQAKNDVYFKDALLNRIIVLEDLNFIWDRSELNELADMWQKGFSIPAMGEYFERDPDEVLLAIIHLAKEEKIMTRIGGGFGWI